MLGYGGESDEVRLSNRVMAESASQIGNEAELLERIAKSRDAVALERIYDRYAGPVYSIILRVTSQNAVAEELTQEVFLRLWRQAGRFDSSRGALAPWLFTVARNISLDQLRSSREKQRRVEHGSDDPPPIAVAPSHESRIDRETMMGRVRKLVETMPEDQRRALELAYFEGLSHSEIAGRMGSPLGTVKTWVRKAVMRLRDELGGVA